MKRRFFATDKVMSFLRDRARAIRANNQKISEWVDDYLNRSMAQGSDVVLLTQWCVSKNLVRRKELQGGILAPTQKEIDMFSRDIPEIAVLLRENGFRLNWWLSFNRNHLDSRRVDIGLEREYKAIIEDLASPSVAQGWMLLVDWEDDVLGGRPVPDPGVLADVRRYVSAEALALEMRWNRVLRESEAVSREMERDLENEVVFQIACEAEEGRFICGADFPFGECIMIPLEVAEQYDFFGILVPEFKRRIAPVLRPYPWRLKEHPSA